MRTVGEGLRKLIKDKEKLSRFKGTVSRDFLLLVFFMNQFPPAPEYFIKPHSNFFENSRRYSQDKVHHRYQRHRLQIFHRCQRHRRYQRHRRQILPPVSLVLLVLVANLPPVSTTQAAKLPPVSTTPTANLPRCQLHQWQIMGTISGCCDLKVNLKVVRPPTGLFYIERDPHSRTEIGERDIVLSAQE
jgi:hypothetical protein